MYRLPPGLAPEHLVLCLEIHPESIAVAIRFERCLADLTLAHTDGELLQSKGIVNNLLERRHHIFINGKPMPIRLDEPWSWGPDVKKFWRLPGLLS